MIKKLFLVAVCVLCFGVFIASTSKEELKYNMSLSDYGFFKGNIADQLPADGVIPYQLNTPLFSDYAEKLRFVKLPNGATVNYKDKEVLEFPVGTIIMKTFYYYNDARKPKKGRRLMETRVLIHEEKGWTALPYVWDENQTDAYLDVAGDTKEATWKDEKGKKRTVNYIIPNKNQCKGCHSYDNKVLPIGPTARQLNGKISYHGFKTNNQIEHWINEGWIKNAPAINEIPKIAVWDDPTTGNVESRARAWLDINCAHCHNPKGPGKTSGLNLYFYETEPAKYGVFKAPVAAGRGAADRKFNIVPGDPDASILVYRMETTEPGEMMPELGRTIKHKEGIQLVKDWIAQMDK